MFVVSLKSNFANNQKLMEKKKFPPDSKLIIVCTQEFYKCFIPKEQNCFCDLF